MRASRRQAAPLVALMSLGTKRAPAGLNSGARAGVCACVRACVCVCVCVDPSVCHAREREKITLQNTHFATCEIRTRYV